MNDAYLTRCVVDPLKRKIYMYSSEGDEKTVDCETVEMRCYHTSILFDGHQNQL